MKRRSIEGSVVVLTGASSGIGRATAHGLAKRGATLVLASRDRAALEEVVRECEAKGGRAAAVPTDVTRADEVQELARVAVAAHGRIDVWINGAAVALFARFGEEPLDAYRRVMETNFFGTVHGARMALAQFRGQRAGVLINIDSVVGGAPQPYTSAYVASKFAVRGLSACLRMELQLERDHDIHVCNVMPSAIDTPFFQHSANYTGRAIKALIPTYRADKVAQAIAALIESPKSELVVGGAGKAALAQATLTPRAYEKLLAHWYARHYFQAGKSAHDTEGNLFRTAGPKQVSGGWTKRPFSLPRKLRWPVALGALGLVAAAAFGLARLTDDEHAGGR